MKKINLLGLLFAMCIVLLVGAWVIAGMHP